VPDVVGMSVAAATIDIEAAGLFVGSVTIIADPAPAGEVIGQSPGALNQVPPGTLVDLVVSDGTG
jgi:beta-lactam-binding protein with PASTA domain